VKVISQAEHFCFLEAEQQAIIVDKVIKAGFSMGWVSALDAYGFAVWTVYAHRDGKHFVVRADEKLITFVELQSKPQRWITCEAGTRRRCWTRSRCWNGPRCRWRGSSLSRQVLCDELPLVGAKRANEKQVLIVNSCRFRPATNSQVAGSGEK
jgi:hypothetical protein